MTTDDAVADDGERAEGGIVYCPGEYSDDLDDLAAMMDHGAPLREAARLAMAIGIHAKARIPRDTWSKQKWRNIAHLNGQFDEAGKYDFSLVFDLLGLRDGDVSLNQLISEYIAGGLRWSRDNSLAEGTNFSQMKASFPELFDIARPDEAPATGG